MRWNKTKVVLLVIAVISIIVYIICKFLNQIEEKNLDYLIEKDSRRNIKDKTIYERYIKRVLDICLSFFGLIIFLPVILLSAITIFIEDPGKVVFSQKRVGINKSYFIIHKLRTMKQDVPDIPTHLLNNPEQYLLKTGKFYRKTSVDEFFQFFDILRGRMSFVGPRPALWNQDDLIEERELYGANSIKPGLTGWAQINGRDELDISTKAFLDGVYTKELRKSSISGFLMDCKCVLGTFNYVINAEGIVEGSDRKCTKK